MKYSFLVAFISGFLLSGCINPEGTIQLQGKVLDEKTHNPVPNRKIIVLTLLEKPNAALSSYAGEFHTDSSGRFAYRLKKVKYVDIYEFCVIGDSTYAHSNNKLNLLALKRDRKLLTFYVRNLVDLTIRINRKSKTPLNDTIYVSWRSDGILYPFELENNNTTMNKRPLWIGGDINSTIHTKVFADKKTVVYWKILQNGKFAEFTDTIFCKRDVAYNVCFDY